MNCLCWMVDTSELENNKFLMAAKAVMETDEVNHIILDTIRHIQKSKKHPFSDLVCSM